MKTIAKQLTRIAAWFSQGINVIFLKGHQNQTVSARSYVNKDHSKGWNRTYTIFNKVFFFQDDHCYRSHLRDIKWSKEYFIYHQNTDK